MKHWSQSYIGLPYSEYDCAQLCIKVQSEQFNRKIDLPNYRPRDLKKISEIISDHKYDFADKIPNPIEGDGVLMIGKGRLNHIGIVCFINNQLYILHAMRNAGISVLHHINSLSSAGLKLEGYYKWK